MAKRKKKKRRAKKISFKLGRSKGRKSKRASQSLSLKGILKVSVVVCVLAGLGIGFVFLGKYVQKAVPVSKQQAILKLFDKPFWVNAHLEEKIYTAARAYGEDLKLDEDVARSVQENIQSLVSLVDGVKVQATSSSLLITAKWRKPIALVKLGRRNFYIDRNMVVMDFVPMPELPIVRVKGLSVTLEAPDLGQVWQLDDLKSATVLLNRFGQKDEELTADKPLLFEIDSIDVSNFNGRLNRNKPHIVLYTKDNIQIIWGAEFGTWQRHLEAPDEEKLTNLYDYYKEHGQLLGGAKYINLRYSPDRVSQPIDGY